MADGPVLLLTLNIPPPSEWPDTSTWVDSDPGSPWNRKQLVIYDGAYSPEAISPWITINPELVDPQTMFITAMIRTGTSSDPGYFRDIYCIVVIPLTDDETAWRRVVVNGDGHEVSDPSGFSSGFFPGVHGGNLGIYGNAGTAEGAAQAEFGLAFSENAPPEEALTVQMYAGVPTGPSTFYKLLTYFAGELPPYSSWESVSYGKVVGPVYDASGPGVFDPSLTPQLEWADEAVGILESGYLTRSAMHRTNVDPDRPIEDVTAISFDVPDPTQPPPFPVLPRALRVDGVEYALPYEWNGELSWSFTTPITNVPDLIEIEFTFNANAPSEGAEEGLFSWIGYDLILRTTAGVVIPGTVVIELMVGFDEPEVGLFWTGYVNTKEVA